MKTRLAQIASKIVVVGLVSVCSQAVEIPDYWAQHNKDGHWRNSSSHSLQGDLKVSWCVGLTNFWRLNYAQPYAGQRANHLSVRDGRILVVVPSTDPDANMAERHYATYGIFSLKDGQLLQTTLSPHTGGGAITTYGTMDTDMIGGVINQYWNSQGVVFTAHGSDLSGQSQFDPYTGEFPFDSPRVSLVYPPNTSGYFAMSDANPLIYARGGHDGHSPFDIGGEMGLMGNGSSLLWSSALKMYASFVVDGDWVYPITVLNRETYNGVQIGAFKLTSSPSFNAEYKWSYTNNLTAFQGFGNNHAMGAPRAYCLGEDERLYYFGYRFTNPVAPAVQSAVLVGVNATNGAEELSVDIPYDPVDRARYINNVLVMYPQIATRSNYVVAFQPQQGLSGVPYNRGHVYCVDTQSKTLAWRYDFATSYFKCRTHPSSTYNTEQAVQMTIAGEHAYVVEPMIVNTQLQLRVERFALSDGTHTTSTFTLTNQFGNAFSITNTTSFYTTVREVAAVDGKLVCLLDVKDLVQALVVIDGTETPATDYRPVAVMSKPITGQPFNFKAVSAASALPSNQFDTGAPIQFSAQGSFDPDSGVLAYDWDFGDGTHSSESNPVHAYTATGSPLSVTQYVATLRVQDQEGNWSLPVQRKLALRDVGSVQTITRAAVEDATVNLTPHPSSLYGTAANLKLTRNATTRDRIYVKFDLSGVEASQVVKAVLRFKAGPVLYAANTLQVRAVSSDWNEGSICGTNAPDLGDVLAECAIPSVLGTYYDISFPVTEYVQRAGTNTVLNFGVDLADVMNAGPSFYSRETGKGPELIISYGNPGCTAPTITQQPPSYVQQPEVLTASFSLAASSSASTEPLTYSWRALSGPGVLTYSTNHNSSAFTVSVAASTTGVYRLVCTVSDGLQSTESQVVLLSFGQEGAGAPDIQITRPTGCVTGATEETSILVEGWANEYVIKPIRWVNSQGGFGTADFTGSSFQLSVDVAEGTNVITVMATNGVGNSVQDSLCYVREPSAQSDLDGDGLLNGEEWMLGLDIYRADSDGDGLPDGQEDTDGDGLGNLEEKTLGLLPWAIDSDGDGLADGEEDVDGDGLGYVAEKLHGTLYDQADTDGDGVNDGAEVSRGQNPTRPDRWYGVTEVDSFELAPEVSLELVGLNNYQQICVTSSERLYAFNWLITPEQTLSLSPSFRPTALDDSGYLSGYRYNPTGYFHAVVYDPVGELLRDVDPGWGIQGEQAYSVAMDINDDHEVCGYAVLGAQEQRSFATRSGVFGDLGDLGFGLSKAYGINLWGCVVGQSATATGLGHAFVYDGISQQDIHPSWADADQESWAYGINDLNQIVGVAYRNQAKHVFVTDIDSTNALDLGVLPDRNHAEAVSINSGGQVVGVTYDTEKTNRFAAFLYANQTLFDLASLVFDSEEVPDWQISPQSRVLCNSREQICALQQLSNNVWRVLLFTPMYSDSNGNGLSDFEEVRRGTCPYVISHDTDLDGLKDEEELSLYHTNPQQADSDMDGMPDGWEVRNQLDPLAADAHLDADGDGCSNGQEYQLRTNPQAADTDADGMPDGWEYLHGLNPLMSDSSWDVDGDGLSNFEEYQVGADPMDPFSPTAAHENLALASRGSLLMECYRGEQAIDGLTNNYNGSTGFAQCPVGKSMVLDLNAYCWISQIKLLLWDKDSRTYAYRLFASMDGIQWDEIVPARAGKSWQNIPMTGNVMARYLKLEALANSANSAFHVVEWQVFGRVHLSMPIPVMDNVALASQGARLMDAYRGGSALDGISSGATIYSSYAEGSVGKAMYLDLQRSCFIEQIRMRLWDNDSRMYGYKMEASEDGRNWTEIVPARTGQSWQFLPLSSRVQARYLKLQALSNTANSGFHVIEWQVFGVADEDHPVPPQVNVARASQGAVLNAVNGVAALDGLCTGYNGNTGYAYCMVGSSMTLNLGRICSVDQVRLLLWDGDARTYGYRIEASSDGSTWQEVVPARTGRSWQFLSMPSPVQARYLRLQALSNTANGGFHLVEWEVYEP